MGDPRQLSPIQPAACLTCLSTNSIGMSFRRIASGTFMMGTSGSGPSPFLSETQHSTTITRDFCIGTCQVTQSQYSRVMKDNPSCFHGDGTRFDSSNHPIENVSWFQAYAFCHFLSALPEEKKSGCVYRLPTEAEWEYACRAGSNTKYSFGDDVAMLDQAGWSGRNSAGRTAQVGQKTPNAWGVYDMHGNVLEWCRDWYAPYSSQACVDPIGPPTGYGRVFRGGSWDLAAQWCGSAFRSMNHPAYRMNNLGFRVVMNCVD
jgi:formylglycine-generating enzyme required for sulfatase activity